MFVKLIGFYFCHFFLLSYCPIYFWFNPNFKNSYTFITLLTKAHLVKAMVFPVAMYGYESWTIKKA